MKFVPILILGALLLSVIGCSGNNNGTVPVYGKVVFDDGQPARIGNVEFRKIVKAGSDETRLIARGKIESDGSFLLTTFEPNDGAIPGNYDIICQQLVITEDRSFESHNHGRRISPVYADYGTSGLSASILTPKGPDDRQTNAVTLKLRVDPSDKPPE